MKNLNMFIVDETAWEFQAKQEQEFELSSTLIFVWPGL